MQYSHQEGISSQCIGSNWVTFNHKVKSSAIWSTPSWYVRLTKGQNCKQAALNMARKGSPAFWLKFSDRRPLSDFQASLKYSVFVLIPSHCWYKVEWAAPLFHGILSPLFSVRVNCPRLSRTTEDPQSLWKNKRWSGRTSPCRACTKTHPALEAERRIWTVG